MTTITQRLEKIPPELKARLHWVVWRQEDREGKPTKIPYQPQNPKQKASSTKPDTWGAFEQAIGVVKVNGFAGIGYEFGADDPFTGIDLDKCRNPETGEIELWAREIIDRLRSYTEISPSGSGLHILVRGKLPPGGNRKGKVEMYDSGRYFTMTGDHLPGTPSIIEPRQTELNALHTEIFGKPQASPPKPAGGPGPALDLSDFALIDRAKAATNGHKFCALWDGDTSGYGGDDSSADLALCGMLAFWTGPDPGRIDRLFRQSGLYREKWERQDYRDRTITKALDGMTEFYQGPRSMPQVDPASPSRPAPEASKFQIIKPAAPTIQFVTGRELESIEFKDPAWVVPEILPEGLCLLSARPKKGKTWIALGISVAKSTGGCALGKGELRLIQGKVLYLCLEDKLRRAQKRLKIILGDDPFPEDLILAESWPRLDKGGLSALQDFLKEHDDCKLVVVDSFAKIKPPRPKNADAYEFDMAMGGVLQSLAQERQICLLLIYHNRKAEADDPIDDVINSTGLTGAVDAILILRRGRGQADGTLFVTGRDVEEQAFSLKFQPKEGLWELMGTAAECAISQERKDILLILKDVGSKTPAQLSKLIGKSKDAVRMNLARMKDAGMVSLMENGEYQIV